MRIVVAVIAILLIARVFGTQAASHVLAVQYRVENEALDREISRGEAAFVQHLVANVQANGSDAAIPNPSPLPTTSACSSTPCKFTASADFTITAQPTTSLSSGYASYQGNDTAYNLERQSLVRENTVAVQINSHIWSALGGSRANRCVLMTFRIMSQDPYYETTGESDCAAHVGVALERDHAGCDPSSATSCDPTGRSEISSTKTTAAAIVQCRDYGQWSCNGAAPQPADVYVNNTYQNGNQQTGWTH